jgi:hypothetical protein
MSRGSGSSFIPVAVFLAILLIVLPVSADNVTTSQTTVATTVQTTVTTTPITNVTTSQTTVATTPTLNATASQTTVTTSETTVTPVNTTVAVTQLTTVVTTANLTVSSAETLTTGDVNVYSSPTGASILIDGIYAGTTPKTLNGLPAGNHILRLSLSGYYDYEGSIYIVPGQPAQGYGTLQRMSPVTPAALTPVPTPIPVIVPVVTPTPEPTQDPGLFGNPSVIAAIIGSFTVLVAVGASIFTHLTPPKKE